MDESKLKVFIEGATRYFVQVTRLSAEVGTPYLSETNETLAYDMTGIIGISGGRKGVVYFTAPTNMLRSVLINMGERDVTHDMRLDLVGEIANTIAGNARAEFGSEFMISVPVVIAGALETVRLPKDIRAFVIPITWHSQRAAVIIALE
jgi:chemotaxis protein CheX